MAIALREARSLVLATGPARPFPDGIGIAAARDYMALRDEARDALAAGDPRTALDIVGACLEEAGRVAHRATADLVDARRLADRVATLHAALEAQQELLDAEEERLRAEQRELDVARKVLEAERQDLLEALVSAGARGRQAALGATSGRGKAPSAAHPRPPESVIPDLNATLRPDPASAGSSAQFMELLRSFRIWAGRPSYRDMAAGTQRFTASALHAALGRDVLPARHEMVDAIVTGCGGSDEDRRMWATAWRRLAMQPDPSAPHPHTPALPGETAQA
jgi:hypothetical protein